MNVVYTISWIQYKRDVKFGSGVELVQYSMSRAGDDISMYCVKQLLKKALEEDKLVLAKLKHHDQTDLRSQYCIRNPLDLLHSRSRVRCSKGCCSSHAKTNPIDSERELRHTYVPDAPKVS
jgi:hypothetical protein